MCKLIFEYVDGCATYQSTKNLPNHPHPPLHPIPPLPDALPFTTTSMDFITQLPKSHGFDAVTVFVDYNITKTAVIVPCTSDIISEQTTLLYCDHVWKHFGLPCKLITDCSTQFTSKFTTA